MKTQICTKCIIDTTVPAARFDSEGECNYCKISRRLEAHYPLGKIGERRLDRLIQQIKAAGRNQKYDCIVGISGGRDSIYTLYLVKQLGLRPLAVHFNDGFGNPVAGENMKKATQKLGVDLRTITSDWRESKDIKIAFLKSSTPDLEQGTDIGIEGAFFGVATEEKIKFVLSGYSFRTEGICPLEWNYLDGRYLKSVHRQFGSVKLRKWKPTDPGFNLMMRHIFYYTFIKKIRIIPLLCYVDYPLNDAVKLIEKELEWVFPGAKYYDDLYQSLMTYIYRVKFNIDRRKVNYSARVRAGQMSRDDALERVKEIYAIEDPKVIDLCVKRLGLKDEEIERFLKEPPRTFRDYETSYRYIRLLKMPVRILSKLNVLAGITYDKYFECV